MESYLPEQYKQIFQKHRELFLFHCRTMGLDILDHRFYKVFTQRYSQPPSFDLFLEHMQGKIRLHFEPTEINKFIYFDLDFRLDSYREIYTRLMSVGLEPVFEKSEHGFHLFVFLDDILKKDFMIGAILFVYITVADILPYVDFFLPMRYECKGSMNSVMTMPFFFSLNRTTNKTSFFVDKCGEVISDQFNYVMNIPTNPVIEMSPLINRLPCKSDDNCSFLNQSFIIYTIKDKGLVLAVCRIDSSLYQIFGKMWYAIYHADCNMEFRNNYPNPNIIKKGAEILCPIGIC